MEIAHIIVSVLLIFMVGIIGLCVGLAFKKSKTITRLTDNNENVVTKRSVPDIEDLDLGVFSSKKKNK